MTAKELELDFGKWWLEFDQSLASDVVKMRWEERSIAIKRLALIAYTQGRIDECTRLTEQLSPGGAEL